MVYGKKKLEDNKISKNKDLYAHYLNLTNLNILVFLLLDLLCASIFFQSHIQVYNLYIYTHA